MTLIVLYAAYYCECLIPDVSSKCLGNIMRVDVGPLGGNLLDIAAVISKVTFLDSVFFLFTLFFFFFFLLTVLFSSSR